MPNRNQISRDAQKYEALNVLIDLVLKSFHDDKEMKDVDGEDPEAQPQIGLSENNTNDMKVDDVQVSEEAPSNQAVDRKGKRPLQASTEEETIKPQENVKEIILGGSRGLQFDYIRNNEYLSNLVSDTGTQRLFLEAILAYFEERRDHPLRMENREDFLTETLGIVGVRMQDFDRAIRMVWPNVHDLRINAIKEALRNGSFCKHQKVKKY